MYNLTMDKRLVMRGFLLLLLAAAFATLFRYQLVTVSGAPIVFRLDRWTGAVTSCAPADRSLLVQCGATPKTVPATASNGTDETIAARCAAAADPWRCSNDLLLQKAGH